MASWQVANGLREIIIIRSFRYEFVLELSATEANDLSRLVYSIFCCCSAFSIYTVIMIVVGTDCWCVAYSWVSPGSNGLVNSEHKLNVRLLLFLCLAVRQRMLRVHALFGSLGTHVVFFSVSRLCYFAFFLVLLLFAVLCWCVPCHISFVFIMYF